MDTLLDMYLKCMSINAACSIFDSTYLRDKNVVSWTIMIGGYAQHGDANAALELLSQIILKASSVGPNSSTISCVLMACARLAALCFGKQIHAYMTRNPYDPAMLFIANCLLKESSTRCQKRMLFLGHP